MKKISICVPVLNEEDNIEAAYVAIRNIFLNDLNDYKFEIIFTDNHSTDNTEEIITKICNNDSNIKYNYIISTISKQNLIDLNIWNSNQIRDLNSVININSYNIKEVIDIIIKLDKSVVNNNNEYVTKELLLNNLQFIYPQIKNKNKKIALWKTYYNIADNNNIQGKIMFREKIKFLYNNRFFICNLGYSSNNIFINYLLDSIDKTNFVRKKK